MRVILDTDAGADDTMALAYALAHPDIELVGVTTVFGNTTVGNATRNMLHLLQYWNSDTPVAEGAASPSGPAPNRWHLPPDMKDGLGDVTFLPLTREAINQSAAGFLVETVRKHPGEIDICAIGPLTNIAAAIDYDPAFAEKVRSIVIMGGAIFQPGNTTQFAEANISNDPTAAQTVFSSGAPIVLAPLDVTEQVTMGETFLTELAIANPDCGDILQTIIRSFLRMSRKLWGEENFVPHDLLTLGYLTDPGLFRSVKGRIDVVVDGEEIGRTVYCESDAASHRVLTGIDSNAFKVLAFQTLVGFDSGGMSGETR